MTSGSRGKGLSNNFMLTRKSSCGKPQEAYHPRRNQSWGGYPSPGWGWGYPSPVLAREDTTVLSWPGGGIPVLSWTGRGVTPGLGYPPGWDWDTPPPGLGTPSQPGLGYPPPPPPGHNLPVRKRVVKCFP